jgi:hypothetical protein
LSAGAVRSVAASASLVDAPGRSATSDPSSPDVDLCTSFS